MPLHITLLDDDWFQPAIRSDRVLGALAVLFGVFAILSCVAAGASASSATCTVLPIVCPAYVVPDPCSINMLPLRPVPVCSKHTDEKNVSDRTRCILQCCGRCASVP